MEVVIREIMEDKIYLDLSGQVQTREGLDEELPAGGEVVDLTQPEQ
jgi:hypothetical protein